MVAPLIIVTSLAMLQLIFLLITYANFSIAADRGARYLLMGYAPSTVISKTQNDLDKFKFYGGTPLIQIKSTSLGETNLFKVQVSMPIDWPFGMRFVLTTMSYAT